MKLNAKVNSKDRADFEMRSDDALLNCDRWRVPSDVMLRNMIMEEVHSPTYAM